MGEQIYINKSVTSVISNISIYFPALPCDWGTAGDIGRPKLLLNQFVAAHLIFAHLVAAAGLLFSDLIFAHFFAADLIFRMNLSVCNTGCSSATVISYFSLTGTRKWNNHKTQSFLSTLYMDILIF